MSDRRRCPNLRHAATFAVFILLLAVGDAAAQCPEGARAFWQSFREDALSGDPVRIAARTRFPFQLRGTLDASGSRKVEPTDFPKIVPKLLEADPGLAPTPSTMRKLAAATVTPAAESCNASGTQLRVGSWVFALTDQGWRFVQAYVDD